MRHLLCALLVVAVTWLVILPAVSRWDPVQRHIRSMQTADIAVDAMFYTELNWLPGQ
jgi:hypothetical protein